MGRSIGGFRRWAAAWAAACVAALGQGCFQQADDAPRVETVMHVRVAPGELFHVVAQGETLWGLAELYGVSVSRIASRNGLHGDVLRPGDLLRIPGPEGEESAAGSTAPSGPPASEVAAPAERAPEVTFHWPVRGPVIQRYGVETDVGPACGIDIAARAGTPICAAKSGRARFVSESLRGMGKVVILDHGADDWTLYGHLGTTGVSAGDRVKQGDAIGSVGRSGGAESDRLHFRIYRRGRPVDPLGLLR